MPRAKRDDHGYMMWCPGCEEIHAIIDGRGWGFNGDVEKPTFSPSIRISKLQNGEWVSACHSHVVNGNWEYCTDCNHSLAGQTVEIPDFDIAMGR